MTAIGDHAGTADSEYNRLPEMTYYVLGLYRRMPHRSSVSDQDAEQLQQGHMGHLRRLTETGELITAGPFEGDGDYRGLMIFSRASIEQARKLLEEDPAIKQGRLVIDLFTWFGPAGLKVVPPAH
ncbi:MAG: YciI family protein [Thermoplasmata archaeon]